MFIGCRMGILNKIMKNGQLAILLALVVLLGGFAAAQITPNPIPSRILGQLPPPSGEIPQAPGTAPNLLEGRELFGPLAVAVDNSVAPPAVYVADTNNNRVLGWRNSSEFQNGAPANVVLGQKNLQSSIAYAALEASFYSALSTPTSVAVDAQGNVFVMDAGGNRILRFPRPWQGLQGSAGPAADLIIGQRGRTDRLPNQSTSASAPPNASTLRTASSSIGVQLASLTFDPDGNLWVSDSGNHRLLRYHRDAVSGPSNITGSGTVQPVIEASLVVGQAGFDTNTANPGNSLAARRDKTRLRYGGAITFDPAGHLYYADDLARVLFYQAPLANGKAADRILGASDQPVPAGANSIYLGGRVSGTTLVGGPRGLFVIDGRLFVSDTYNNRIVRFDPPVQWPAEATLFSPVATGVWAQPNLWTGQPNRWTTFEPGADTLNSPGAAVFANNEVWIADTGNNRVLAVPNLQTGGNLTKARGVLGQVSFEFRAPNFIQGREFSAGTLRASITGGVIEVPVGPNVAIDRSSDTPHVYIADTGNNRILGFRDARTFQTGGFADLVIGQVDVFRNLVNSPFNDATAATANGLSLPGAVAVDAEGNLWVADSGNARVLMFRRPYDDPSRFHRPADLVIGQNDFQAKPLPEATQRNLSRPVSLTFTSAGQLVVADIGHNRVLRYDPPFANGMQASLVLGQPDFTSTATGNGLNQFSLPLAVARDADDRLYVADTTNRRVLIFDRISSGSVQNGANAAYSLVPSSGSHQPIGLTVSRTTGEIFVADPTTGSVRKYPNYLTLLGSATVTSVNMLAYGPRALEIDGRGSLYVIDAASRLTVHSPAINAVNAANLFERIAPGTITEIEAKGVTLASSPGSASGSPLPKDLAGVEVLVNGLHAPLISVDGEKIRCVLPWALPVNKPLEFIVRSVETGEILGYEWLILDVASPGFLMRSGQGAGAIKALNSDGSENTSTNPAARGSEITLLLTGYGQLQGAPEDGTAAAIEAPLDGGTVLLGVRQATVLSSTLDPAEPGVWRVRIRLPSEVAGTAQGGYAFGPVVLVHRSIPTNRNPVTGQILVHTVAIRP